jgi:uncharacterized glyoxalase superfamily protein PhnB
MNTLTTVYPAFSPYLTVRDADKAIAFYQAAFGATERCHQWMLQHEIEKVSPEEMQKRWDAMCGECGGSETA